MTAHVLKIRDLTVSYHGIPAVHHVNLDIHCGNCVALLGPNGAGKTSLFKAMVGLVKPETGSVEFGGHGARRTRNEIAYLPQREDVDWDFPVTVQGLVEMGRYARLGWWRKFGPADADTVRRAIDRMELSELSSRQIRALSGGQQQRAFIARALAQDAHVLLLDEPFNGLDRAAQLMLGSTLRGLAADGNLIIASHHDLKSVPDLFDQVIFLNGELIAHGSTADTFTEENIDKTHGTRPFAGA